MQLTRVVAVGGTAVLLLAGCGSGNSGPTTTPPTAPLTSAAAPASQTAATGPRIPEKCPAGSVVGSSATPRHIRRAGPPNFGVARLWQTIEVSVPTYLGRPLRIPRQSRNLTCILREDTRPDGSFQLTLLAIKRGGTALVTGLAQPLGGNANDPAFSLRLRVESDTPAASQG
jgi:hypothetical protein